MLIFLLQNESTIIGVKQDFCLEVFNSRNERLNSVLICDSDDWNKYSHLSKKVEKKRPLIKNKKRLFFFHHCYTTNVCHELPESANVLASVCTLLR